jgi:hypothetical protein
MGGRRFWHCGGHAEGMGVQTAKTNAQRRQLQNLGLEVINIRAEFEGLD